MTASSSQGDSERNRCNARDDAGPSPTDSRRCAALPIAPAGPADNGCCSPWLPYDKDWRKVAVKFLEGFVRPLQHRRIHRLPHLRSLLYLADYPTTATVVVILEVTLAGAGKVPVDPISSGEPNFWITARKPVPSYSASIGHDDLGDALLLEMTLRPPDEDGAPAAMQTSIGGIEHALSLGWIDPDVVDDLATLVDKIQRCIAWTWLEMKGYAEPLPLESGAATDLDFILSTSPGDMIYSIGENEDEQSELVFLIAASAQDLAALPRTRPSTCRRPFTT